MTVKELSRKDPKSLIARAFVFSQEAHKKQARKSGEPYFNHALATAEILHSWHLDEATVAAGLLHDTVEDTGVPLETIKKDFGGEVAFLVDGVTKLGHIKYRGAENKAENLRKMVLALSQDLRVVFIKLADRLHNMQTLSALPPAKQKRIAMETDEIYASLAYRLGMHSLSGELQDLAFPYLHPQEYRWLLSSAREQFGARLKYLEKIKPQVKKLLEKHDIKALDIEIRAKRYASLYKKLLRRDMDLGRIYDIVAMRVIVETIPDCYAALGVIHEMWPPLPRRIKDYIAMPKPNGYRSLHTTVIGPDDKTIEFQIRTKEMHDENEYGIAAHWLYDEKKRGGGKISGKDLAKEITWVQQLKNWQERFLGNAGVAEEDGRWSGSVAGPAGTGGPHATGNAGTASDMSAKDHEEFLNSMKVDFFTDRIFAVTPRGDVIDLPAGSTPVDFAYHIHSGVGDNCTGAKVNGALVPLDHRLNSGDVVEILTQKGKKPSEDWLRFVKTSIARDHIRQALRQKNKLVSSVRIPQHAELRIVVADRVGLIKDISTVLANNRMNILSFQAENPKGGKFPFDKVEIQSTDKAKIEKVIVKLRRIKGVREVSYKLV